MLGSFGRSRSRSVGGKQRAVSLPGLDIWDSLARVSTYLVGWLRLELLKELERLLLCRETAHLVVG